MSDTTTLWEFEDEDDWEISCPRCLHDDGVYMPMKHGGRERTFRHIQPAQSYRDEENFVEAVFRFGDGAAAMVPKVWVEVSDE